MGPSISRKIGRLALLVWAGALLAHEGPEQDIEEITAEIATFGESAERLLQRAIEYRVLGRLKEAGNDLDRASRLEPARSGLKRELARVQDGMGRTNEALATVESGLRIADLDPDEEAALRMMRGDFLAARGSSAKALEEFGSAIRLRPDNGDWYLRRSALQRSLGQWEECLSGLEAGIRETGSGTLEIERVEVLLDAGRWEKALVLVEPELEASRLKASWRIRRARALLGLARKPEAIPDLRSALAEIDARLGPGIREASLMADAGLAHELLGERDEAKRWYADAVEAGAGGGVRSRLEALKAAAPPTR